MIHLIALALYTGAFLLWTRALLRGPAGEPSTVAAWVAAAGVVVHFGALAEFTERYGELPLVGLAPSLSSLAFIIGLGLMITLALGEAARVGIVLVPVILLLEGFALALGISPAPGTLDFRGGWFALHVTLAFAGYGGLAIAFAAGVLYLIQVRELRSKRLGRVFRFVPPLATLDRLGQVSLLAGFANLSLAIVLGWAWTMRFRQTLEGNYPEVAWALFSWLVVAGALGARIRAADRERRSAVAAVGAFGLVVVSYVAVRLALVSGGRFL